MAEKVDSWMPLWIGDYLADTMHLTTEQHGAYLLILMAYWRNRGPLPDDDRRLAAITRSTPDAWSMLRASLEEFFRIEDRCWKHDRIDAELASSTERRVKSASKARAAAQSRWMKWAVDAPSNAPSNAQAVLEQCPSPSPSPYTSSLRSDVCESAQARAPGPPDPDPPPAKPAKPRPSRRCPESFEVTDEMRDWARREHPAVNVDRETARMLDHEFRTARSDWRATWRNWIREADDRATARAGPDASPYEGKYGETLARLTGGRVGLKPSARQAQPAAEVIDAKPAGYRLPFGEGR